MQARQHLLAGRAAAAHVELGAAGEHDDAVVVGAAGMRAVRLRLDLDVIDVLIAVCLLPELLDDLVDVRHLGRVERQQRLLQGLQQ